MGGKNLLRPSFPSPPFNKYIYIYEYMYFMYPYTESFLFYSVLFVILWVF